MSNPTNETAPTDRGDSCPWWCTMERDGITGDPGDHLRRLANLDVENAVDLVSQPDSPLEVTVWLDDCDYALPLDEAEARLRQWAQMLLAAADDLAELDLPGAGLGLL